MSSRREFDKSMKSPLYGGGEGSADKRGLSMIILYNITVTNSIV